MFPGFNLPPSLSAQFSLCQRTVASRYTGTQYADSSWQPYTYTTLNFLSPVYCFCLVTAYLHTPTSIVLSTLFDWKRKQIRNVLQANYQLTIINSITLHPADCYGQCLIPGSYTCFGVCNAGYRRLSQSNSGQLWSAYHHKKTNAGLGISNTMDSVTAHPAG